MKKLVLLVAAVFLAGFTFAQNNTGNTTVTGNDNNSHIYQTGHDQEADVTQTGNHNDADVDQDNSDASNVGTQYATSVQTGNWNEVIINMNQKISTNAGQNNHATITQTGNYNKSNQQFWIDYNNKSNNEEGLQTGHYNDLTQIINGGYNETLKAEQDGSYNDAYQYSWGSAVYGKIYQVGNHNDADQTLGSRSVGKYTTPSGGPIYIEQLGNWNKADQDFNGKNLSGTVLQDGNSNESWQIIDGQMDETFVEIDGSNNYTRQVIDGGWNGNIDVSNFSEVYLDGNNNDVRTTQDGSFNWARIDINGDVYGHVGDANWNDVDVIQYGDHNQLKFTIPRGDVGGDYNDLNANQNGNGHLHRIVVDGSYNDIDIDADGNVGGSQSHGNKGDWKIKNGDPLWSETSDYNKLYLKQYGGEKNWATGSIAGDHNDVDIRQNGSENTVGSEWSATDGVVIDGNWNEVDIRQTGISMDATVTITGNSNTSTTIQN